MNKKFTKKEANATIQYFLLEANKFFINKNYKDSAKIYLKIAKFINSYDKLVILENNKKDLDDSRRQARE